VALSQRARLGIVPPLFLLSGGTALLYQVAFGKKLATIFGATAYAVSAVLAAFMGGLALGSWLGGRHAARFRRPLVAYGVAEIIVGGVCAVTPWLFEAVAGAYVAAVGALPSSLAVVSTIRGLITALVVLVPTIAMGLTLPMLSRAVAGAGGDEEAQSRRRLARLYAINTGGGALGALLSAYWVLPALGVYTTMRAAAVINVGIGVVAIASGRDFAVEPPLPSSQEEEPAARRSVDRLLGILALASGLLVFAAEVVDTHLLALLIGNSAYAFGLMLAAFLCCLSVGATLAEWFDRRFEQHALAIALFVTAVALLLILPLWGQLPRLFLAAGHRVSSWLGREAVRGAAAFGVLALPTVGMGLTFPLLLRRVAARPDVAAQVGRLTAINTVGSIVGSLLCGYVMLSALGSEWMLRVIAIAFAATGVLAAHWGADRSGRTPSLIVAGLVVLVGIVLPRWDMKLMTNGANVYFDTQPIPDELVFVQEDVHGGLTSVARRGDVLTMYTNGKFQGDNGHEVTAQRSFAHFPSVFVKRHDRALVIGLGTGTTLGTIAAYPYRTIEVAEISPAIVTAARRYFEGPNRGSIDDPRVTMVLNDGRNVLLLAEPARYDLVTIELTSVWFAGAANLYSQEFYQLVASKLAPQGVLQQWVQLHHIRRQELAVTLRTVRSAFDHVALFVSGGQGIIVASRTPLMASRSRLAGLTQEQAIAASLDGSTLLELLDRLTISGAALDRFIAETPMGPEVPELSTDENLYLEYATPKGNVMNYDRSITAMVALLKSYRPAEALSAHLVD
jgi:spermidine synthase